MKINGLNITKEKIYLGVIILVVIVGLINLGLYMFSPKVRFVTALTNTYDGVFESLSINENDILKLSNDQKSLVSVDLSLGTDGLYDLLGIDDLNLKLSGQIENDPTNKLMQFDADLYDGTETLLGAKGLLDKEKLYFTVKDSLDGYYYTDGKYSNYLSTDDYSDYEYLLGLAKDSVTETMTSSNFTKSSDTVTINGDKKKLTKLSVEIDQQMVNDIEVNLLNKILNDKDAQEIVIKSNVFGEYSDKEELVKAIKDEIKTVEAEKVTDEVLMTYNMYIKGYNTVCRHEIITSEKETLIYDIYSKDKTNYKLFELTSDSEKVFSILLKETGENAYDMTGNVGEDTSLVGSLKYSETAIDVNVKITSGEEELELSYDSTQTVKEANKKYEVATNFEFSYSGVELTISSKVVYEFGKDMAAIDVSGAKSVDDITDDEMMNVYEKIMAMPIISSYLSSTESYDDSEYYYDDSYYYDSY